MNVIILDCWNIEITKDFYEKAGFQFVKEKHGDGPEHYATQLEGGFVFELYPIQEGTKKFLNAPISHLTRLRLLTKKHLKDFAPEDQIKGSGILRVKMSDPEGRDVTFLYAG
jgi:hypothetical protein